MIEEINETLGGSMTLKEIWLQGVERNRAYAELLQERYKNRTHKSRLTPEFWFDPPSGNHDREEEDPGMVRMVCPHCGAVYFQADAPGALPITEEIKERRLVFNTDAQTYWNSHSCSVMGQKEVGTWSKDRDS